MLANLSKTLLRLASAVLRIKSALLRAELASSLACWTNWRVSLALTTAKSVNYFLLLAASRSPLASSRSANDLLY